MGPEVHRLERGVHDRLVQQVRVTTEVHGEVGLRDDVDHHAGRVDDREPVRALPEHGRTGFVSVFLPYVHTATERVCQGHVLGGGGPDASTVPARANIHEFCLGIRLADSRQRGHAVEDVASRVARRGGRAVDPLEKTEDEVTARDERLRVVVLVVGMHGDQRRSLDAQAA